MEGRKMLLFWAYDAEVDVAGGLRKWHGGEHNYFRFLVSINQDSEIEDSEMAGVGIGDA
jgi:hypothetical protein